MSRVELKVLRVFIVLGCFVFLVVLFAERAGGGWGLRFEHFGFRCWIALVSVFRTKDGIFLDRPSKVALYALLSEFPRPGAFLEMRARVESGSRLVGLQVWIQQIGAYGLMSGAGFWALSP